MKQLTLFYFLFITLSVFAGNSRINNAHDSQSLLKNQPLSFIENKGQFKNADGTFANNILFKASAGNIDYYITAKGLTYVFNKFESISKKEKVKSKNEDIEDIEALENKDTKNILQYRLDMELIGASIVKSNIIVETAIDNSTTNYYYNNCKDGLTGLKGYQKITIKNIYKGIDWILYTNTNNVNSPLKYDFVVHPEADYKNIKIKFINAQSIILIDKDSKLKIETIAGKIEEGNLKSYQHINTKNNIIDSKYIINKDSIIEFNINKYNTKEDLIIDPLVWATYYGGTANDYFKAICTDHNDNIYITGYSNSTDFPTQQLATGYWQAANASNSDIIILKFNNQSVLQWATYYGGSGNDIGTSIVADSADNIYICGTTTSTDLPTLHLTGAYWQATKSGGTDIIILKFDKQGVRQWATYYGGSGLDVANSIGVNANNNMYITGYTTSTNFPILNLAGAYNKATNSGDEDMFILKFNNQGVRQWATYYGGTVTDIGTSLCFESQNNLLITGYTGSNTFNTLQLAGAFWQASKDSNVDLFIIKINNLDVLQWASFYGGNDEDKGTTIKTDSKDNIYISGHTLSTNFPTLQLSGAYWQPNNFGGSVLIVLKFDKYGVRQWATYYGGGSDDFANSMTIDKQDNIYITGEASSPDFPVLQKSGEYYKATKTGTSDAYILKFCNQGILEWSTYYGSKSRDYGTGITVDSQNNIYFVGVSTDSNAYTFNPGNGAYYDNMWNNLYDGYILKVSSSVLAMLNPNYYLICSEDNTNINLLASLSSSFTWTIGNVTQGITGASAGSGSIINQTLTNPGTTSGIVEYIITPTPSGGGCLGVAFTITITVSPKPITTNIFHN